MLGSSSFAPISGRLQQLCAHPPSHCRLSALLDQQPALAQSAVTSPETRAALLTPPFLDGKRCNNLFYQTKQENNKTTQNSCDKCCWEGYGLSIPARDFLQGILVLSFLLPEQTDLGKDITGCPEMLDMARWEKGTTASSVCLCAEQSSKEQIQVDSDLNQKQQLLQCSEIQEHQLGMR